MVTMLVYSHSSDHAIACGGNVQVTDVLAAKSAQRREAAMHHQLVLLSRAMLAWFSWLGMHLANATAKQERLLYLQVSCVRCRPHLDDPQQTFPSFVRGEPSTLLPPPRNTCEASLIAHKTMLQCPSVPKDVFQSSIVNMAKALMLEVVQGEANLLHPVGPTQK